LKYIQNLTLLLLLILFGACSSSKPDKLVTSFSNNLTSTTLATNRVSQIRVYANYDDGSQEEVTDTLLWSSSDESIATVSDGLLKTYAISGNVDIKYETQTKDSEGVALYEKSVSLSVKNLLLKSIALSKSKLSLLIGESSAIYASGSFEDNVSSEITTQDITDDVNWSSLDDNISSVVAGLVKGVAEGNTTIVASDSNISASMAVEVIKTHYVSVSIYSDRSSFNVDQSIKLEARATTDTGKVVILDDSEVIFTSSWTAVVTLSTSTAKAISSGDSTIKVSIKGTAITNSIVLHVDKEKYVRLFKDGVEVGMPYVSSESNSTLADTLGTFTLLAVGEDFKTSILIVKDFNENIILSPKAYFDSLIDLDTLYQDINKTFYLKQDGNQKQLHFFFDINDSAKSSFSQKYEEKN